MKQSAVIMLFCIFALFSCKNNNQITKIGLSGTWNYQIDSLDQGVAENWFTNRPLALAFEAKVGKVKIIVRSTDLVTDLQKRPEAQQLLYSLKKYMAGKDFNLVKTVDFETLSKI